MGEVIRLGTPFRLITFNTPHTGEVILSDDTPPDLQRYIVEGVLRLPNPYKYPSPKFRFIFPIPIEYGGGVAEGEFHREKAYRGSNTPDIFFWRFYSYEEKHRHKFEPEEER